MHKTAIFIKKSTSMEELVYRAVIESTDVIGALGFEIRNKVTAEHLTDKYTVIDKIKIEKSNLGALEPMIKDCTVEISMAIDAETSMVFLRLEYDYNHPNGGHNGHIVAFVYKSSNLKWNLYK